MKKRIYFNEYNVRMGNFSYLPLVSGLLRSYAETFPEVRKNYEFMPFIYDMDVPSRILEQYTEAPDIACFSSVMWNEQLNYHIASQVKKQWPNCLIIFGGPNVPMPPQHSVVDWMAAHPYVDLAVRAEGEEAFVEILKANIESGGALDWNNTKFNRFGGIAGVAWRRKITPLLNDYDIQFCDGQRDFKRSMDEYPSPYLEGLYDYLLEWGGREGRQFQAIIETNRGCPFPCTFCYWGKGGLSRKFRYKDMDRVFAEIDWMGRNRIKYVFNADSNFGMNDRDHEIADFIVSTKKKYGAPEKFRTCFGKNTDEKIFKIGALFHANQLEKGITLARQSNDVETLKNIRRNNIKMSTYVNLQRQFNDLEIPVYCELILGLPGETRETWRKGVDELLEAGTKNQLFIYLCQVFANTEMAEDEYRKNYGIQTRRIKLAEIHGQERPLDFIQEFEDIVMATNSMPFKDWVESLRFSYVLMLFHSLKIAYYPMIYMLDKWGLKMSEFIAFVAEEKFSLQKAPMMALELDFYKSLIQRMIVDGDHRGTIMPEYGDLYWDVEETSFLRVTQNTNQFYVELLDIIFEFLDQKNINYKNDLDQLLQSLLYQKLRIPQQPNDKENKDREVEFDWNFPLYFEKRFSSDSRLLVDQKQWMKIEPESFEDLKDFAKRSILWGRKSGTLLVRYAFGDR